MIVQVRIKNPRNAIVLIEKLVKKEKSTEIDLDSPLLDQYKSKYLKLMSFLVYRSYSLP
jgi:hypothetical protein